MNSEVVVESGTETLPKGSDALNANNDNELSNAPINYRNFRNNPDIENFYRMVHECHIRREAKLVFEHILGHIKEVAKKAKRANRAKKHWSTPLK